MSEEKKKFTLSPLAKKIINIAVDAVIAVVLVLALILAISTIRSRSKGINDYTEVFGKAYVYVKSPSMECDYVTKEVKEDNFSVNDLIKIDILSESEKDNLKVGDVISFQDHILTDKKYDLNTHRIVDIKYDENGKLESVITHGDNVEDSGNYKDSNLYQSPGRDRIVGKFVSKSAGIGVLFRFMDSSTGFFVCIVLPTLLVVAYCAVNLVLVIRKEKKVQTAAADEAKAQELDAERERIRAELLAEMNAKAEQPAAEEAKEPEAEKAEKVEELKEPDDKEEEKVEEPSEGEQAEVKDSGKTADKE